MDLARLILELSKLLNLLLAALLGFAIGFERKLRFKEAGIRTHMIVCVGSALLTVVGKYAFDGANDASRIAAQIVSGVGFLGAGIIMLRGKKMRGLTTAAGIWSAAGVGMACGSELWIVAIGATALIVGIQFLTHSKLKLFRVKRLYTFKIRFGNEDNAAQKIKEIFGVDRFNDLVITRRYNNVVIAREEGESYYSAVLKSSKELSSVQLNEIMMQYPFIDAIERCDED